jgi:hypothetical protein
MPVVVKLTPLLQKYVSDYDQHKGIEMEKAAGKKVSQLIEELSVPKEKITSVLVNHKPSRSSFVVRDNDLVLLALVMGGG